MRRARRDVYKRQGLVTLVVASWVSDLLGLTALNWVLLNVVNNGTVVLVILFQPEPVSYTHLDVYKRQEKGLVGGTILYTDSTHVKAKANKHKKTTVVVERTPKALSLIHI